MYCKSCLKKLKAGEIQPAVSNESGSGPSAGRQTDQVKWTNNNPSRAGQSGNMQPGNDALAGLGIEFAQPSRDKNPSFAKASEGYSLLFVLIM